MLDSWINSAIELSHQPADLMSGCRKIIQNKIIVYDNLGDDLKIEDSGYTQMKLNLLKKGYYHQESHNVARMLWERRLKQGKYGSVGFTTYNHLLKRDPNTKSKTSIMGPCIQSVTLTLLEKSKKTNVDIFYRTTEYYKKFPADLVFIRDTLLKPFDMKLNKVTFYFANITMHPMYFLVICPHLDDPIEEIEKIRKVDPYFGLWIVKWSARYLVPKYNRGIQKFDQAMRVYRDVRARMDPGMLEELIEYLEEVHPPMKTQYKGKD